MQKDRRMFVYSLLLCFAAAPPTPETIPRWIPDLPHPAQLRGVWLTSATRAMLTDPDVKVRRSAATAVSDSRDPQVVLPLLRAFKDSDAEVRKQAVRHFGGYPDPRATEPLTKLLHDPDASVRNESLHALYCCDKDPRIVPPMLEVLQNPKETEVNRCVVARDLPRTKDRRVADHFLQILKDHSAQSSVRCEVAKGLQQLGDNRAVEPLIALLSDASESAAAQTGAAEALAKFNDSRATELLIRIARSDGPRDLRCWAAIGAVELTRGAIDDTQCIFPIIDGYHALDGVEKDLAAKYSALATVVEHATDKNVRLVAARMLSGMWPAVYDVDLPFLSTEETPVERSVHARLDQGMEALQKLNLSTARAHFESSQKLLPLVIGRERKVVFQSQIISAMATIAETEQRWSKMTPTEIAAEQAGVNALYGKAEIYFRGDPFITHDARPSVAPTVLIGSDPLVEVVITHFGKAQIQDIDMKCLKKMPGIRVLRLEHSEITPAGLEYAKDLPNLEFLGLPKSIADANLQFLAGFPRLTILRLQGKGITDDGLKLVAHVQGLRRLSLQETAISDRGLKHLIGLKQLREVSLGWTQIGDAGLEQLAAMKQLQELRVNDTRVTSEGLDKLQKALPNCRIVHDWPMYVGRHAI